MTKQKDHALNERFNQSGANVFGTLSQTVMQLNDIGPIGKTLKGSYFTSIELDTPSGFSKPYFSVIKVSPRRLALLLVVPESFVGNVSTHPQVSYKQRKFKDKADSIPLIIKDIRDFAKQVNGLFGVKLPKPAQSPAPVTRKSALKRRHN